jgi:DNA-binding MarR family transcriptional regulator
MQAKDDTAFDDHRHRMDKAVARSLHPPVHDIRDMISFRLSNLVAANDRVGQGWMQTQFGLSLNEWRVLGLTFALEPVIVSEVKNILHIDKGQLSRVIKSMVERGYIRSEPRSDDQRFTELRMAARGRALHQKMLAYSTKRNNALLEGFTPEEARELFRLLDKIRAGIEQRLSVLEAN